MSSKQKGALAFEKRKAKREAKALSESEKCVSGDGTVLQKTPQEINDENKRNHKSASAHVIHSKPGTKHSNVPDGPIQESVVTEEEGKEEAVMEEPLEDVPIVPSVGLLAISVIGDVLSDGRNEFTIYYINPGGKNFDLVIFDPITHYVKFAEPVEFVETPPFSMFGQYFPKQRIQFSPVMYQFTMAKLKLLANEPRNYTALQSFKIVTFKNLPRQFVDGNMLYYAYRCMTMLPTATKSVVPSKVPWELGHSVNIINTVGMSCSLGPVFEEYSYSGNWKLVKSKGFHFRSLFGIVTEISFDSVVEIDVCKVARTVYFQLTPRNQFLVYANCGVNICGAFSRYFKEIYPNEEHVRKNNQLQLLAHFPEDIITDTVKICDGVVEHFSDGQETSSTTIRSRFHGEVMREVVDSEYDGLYSINHTAGTGLFKKLIDQYFERAFWWLLWLWFKIHLLDALGMCWNFVIEWVFTPLYKFYVYVSILEKWITLPHPKRALYTSYVTDSKVLNWIVTNTGTVESKLKRELAKVGKVGRLYATGGHLALADVVYPTMLKWLFEYKISHQCVLGEDQRLITFEAVYSPTQSAQDSDRMFEEMRSLPNNTIRNVFFSDDGFITANIDGEHYIFETDFSSCDSSNGLAVFTTFHYMARKVYMGEAAKRIIAQCSRATTAYNPDAKWFSRSEYCSWLPEFFFEYSGNPGTTCYNNIAGVGLFASIIETMISRNTYLIDPELIATAAKNYGWKVSVIPRASYNASTFLKRAYGERSWLCYGAILRSWGHTDGLSSADHFGITHIEFKNSSTEQLTELLIRQKAEQLINEPSSPLIEAIRFRAGLQLTDRPFVITYRDLEERYGLAEWEIAPLIDSIRSLRLGDCITNVALEKIFEVDYGTTPVRGEPDFTFTMGSFSGNKMI
jgi:hypothetical protein